MNDWKSDIGSLYSSKLNFSSRLTLYSNKPSVFHSHNSLLHFSRFLPTHRGIRYRWQCVTFFPFPMGCRSIPNTFEDTYGIAFGLFSPLLHGISPRLYDCEMNGV